MTPTPLTVSHARDLVTKITGDDDGAHARELLELIHGIVDPNSLVGVEVQKQLYAMTQDFESHYQAFMSRL